MPETTLITLAAVLALTGLTVYAVLGGADFGGGVWDLFAFGPRKRDQENAIAHAMGPVWEANHVWLIFVIVVLFTCFPYGYSSITISLFLPLHLALLGIILRGASFVFRNMKKSDGGTAENEASIWSVVFGAASVITPLLLGASFGAITAGQIRVDAGGNVTLANAYPWLTPYTIGCGLLALSASAYLAAVFLTVETTGKLRDDFRSRAIVSGTATAAMAIIVLILTMWEAPWFAAQLIHPRAAPILIAGMLCFAASAWAVFSRRYRLSRVFAVGEVVLLLLGWGIAHRPYLIFPDVTLASAAAPAPTIRFLLISFVIGLALLIPSLALLFRVFKTPPRDAHGKGRA